MAAIETHDHVGGVYMDETPGGAFGNRRYYDRRYWCAWEGVSADTWGLPVLSNAIMDDYGTLVAVPRPPRQPQQ
ncbi:hypothetical protein I6I07_19355 [Achromobacter deleyi]|uniref:Uncharacterized protein n=1 Tax=Achromobacter deleyi TaxID=1353891 RepID=A0A7T4AZC0_9BURK|nr:MULTISPECIES: hypothetical protein [Achromobacter]PJM72082.1 hypothetical protein CV751_03315 [Achromobacter ruhlandii]QQB32805.1 hypothetical protein I6I07_19355 [Achromobacter deleyi]